MNELLKKLKISRNKAYGVGKKISNQIWIHKNYISDFMSETDFFLFSNSLPNDYEFNILRIDLKKNEIAFIYSPDFDKSNEPLVGSSYRVQKNDNKFNLSKIQNPPKDPLIYHHKWLFVKDDYTGFNIKESKERSIEWKTKLGINKDITSRIGRCSFWDKWLIENKLKSRI